MLVKVKLNQCVARYTSIELKFNISHSKTGFPLERKYFEIFGLIYFEL
jgi:hypothetical protein